MVARGETVVSRRSPGRRVRLIRRRTDDGCASLVLLHLAHTPCHQRGSLLDQPFLHRTLHTYLRPPYGTGQIAASGGPRLTPRRTFALSVFGLPLVAAALLCACSSGSSATKYNAA